VVTIYTTSLNTRKLILHSARRVIRMDIRTNSDSSPLQHNEQQSDFYNSEECVYYAVGTGDLNIQNLDWYEILDC